MIKAGKKKVNKKNDIISNREAKKFNSAKAKMLVSINLLWNDYALTFEENKQLVSENKQLKAKLLKKPK
jgi:hypothetical protein